MIEQVHVHMTQLSPRRSHSDELKSLSACDSIIHQLRHQSFPLLTESMDFRLMHAVQEADCQYSSSIFSHKVASA